MKRKHVYIIAGVGCGGLFLLVIAGLILLFLLPLPFFRATSVQVPATPIPREVITIQRAVPTIPVPTQAPLRGSQQPTDFGDLPALYRQLNPGVVNIQVRTQGGGGSGSGFILDEEGHIITNNHVVDQADRVTVVFYDGLEARAEIVGTDDDSDLAVIKVDDLPPDVHTLLLGDSDQVQPGEWVVAFGSPFGLGSTMTLGIVSATGRAIPSGATPFAIPQAIQTDAAINPGNSGGPLLDFQGQVIGVNAQIASGSGGASAGVGFAIPSNVVSRVAPALIEKGSYQWPWIGVTGGSASLLIRIANDLGSQRGAYIDTVEPDGPADKAGLSGSTGTTQVEGVTLPVGGDLVVEADGNPVLDFNDLLVQTAFRSPGDQMELTVLRQGQRQSIPVTLEPRPSSFRR